MEEKKSKRLYWIIGILSLLVIGLDGFIIYDKVINKPEENNKPQEVIPTPPNVINNNDEKTKDNEQKIDNGSNNDLDLMGFWCRKEIVNS